MKTATRSLILLAATAVVGGAIAWFAWETKPDEVTASGKVRRPLYAMPQEAITRVTMSTAAEVLTVEKRPVGWFATVPVLAVVDDREIEKLARVITELASETRFGEGAQQEVPADTLTGLDKPAATVDVEAAGERSKIELGGQSEFNREVYARFTAPDGKSSTITLSASNAAAIVRRFDQVIDIRPTAADADRIIALRVAPRAGVPGRITYAIERLPIDPRVPRYRQERKFTIQEPTTGAADLGTVNAVFSSLARSAANTVVSRDHEGDLSKFGLLDPAVTVTLKLIKRFPAPNDESTFTRELRISDPDDAGNVNLVINDDKVVRRSNVILFADLFPSIELLESKRVFDFSRDDVSRVELDLNEKGSITLERYTPPGADDATWRMLAPEPGRAKAHLVSAIVLAFSGVIGTTRVVVGAAAQDPATLARYGLGEGARRIRFFDATAAPLGTLLIGKVENGQLYLVAEGGNMIVTAPESLVETVPATPQDLIETR
jgi:hypothetical protein